MSAALLVGALQALAVNRQDRSAGAGAKGVAKGFHEPGERLFQCYGIKALEHSAERVMAGHAVLENEDRAKKSLFLPPELSHLDTGFRPANHRRQCDEQHLRQVMPRIEVARVRYRLEYDEEITHPGILHNYGDTRKNPSSTESQVVFYSHAIPLG